MFYDLRYLRFYRNRLTDDLSDIETQAILKISGAGAGARILDVGCGHGRISNRLAEHGLVVTAIDLSREAVAYAEEDSRKRSVDVTYQHWDMRHLRADWSETFEYILVWFSTLGCLEESEFLPFLHDAYRCLRPGGILIADHLNKATFLRREFPIIETHLLEKDVMINSTNFDMYEDAFVTERTTIIDGDIKRDSAKNRIYSIKELKRYTEQAEFASVSFVNFAGSTASMYDQRFMVLAHKS